MSELDDVVLLTRLAMSHLNLSIRESATDSPPTPSRVAAELPPIALPLIPGNYRCYFNAIFQCIMASGKLLNALIRNTELPPEPDTTIAGQMIRALIECEKAMKRRDVLEFQAQATKLFGRCGKIEQSMPVIITTPFESFASIENVSSQIPASQDDVLNADTEKDPVQVFWALCNYLTIVRYNMHKQTTASGIYKEWIDSRDDSGWSLTETAKQICYIRSTFSNTHQISGLSSNFILTVKPSLTQRSQAKAKKKHLQLGRLVFDSLSQRRIRHVLDIGHGTFQKVFVRFANATASNPQNFEVFLGEYDGKVGITNPILRSAIEAGNREFYIGWTDVHKNEWHTRATITLVDEKTMFIVTPVRDHEKDFVDHPIGKNSILMICATNNETIGAVKNRPLSLVIQVVQDDVPIPSWVSFRVQNFEPRVITNARYRLDGVVFMHSLKDTKTGDREHFVSIVRHGDQFCYCNDGYVGTLTNKEFQEISKGSDSIFRLEDELRSGIKASDGRFDSHREESEKRKTKLNIVPYFFFYTRLDSV